MCENKLTRLRNPIFEKIVFLVHKIIMNNKMAVEISKLKRLCINCMQHKGHNLLCPACGYNERQYQAHPLYLKPRTILKNQYVIGMTLGQGGFGITYIGQDLWLQKKVAIKEYLPVAFATRDVQTSNIIPVKKQENTFYKGLQWFIDEARNLAKFDHPNIVRVINFFEDNQTGYMVMDYLEGLSPENRLSQAGGHLSVPQALAIILPLLDALALIHAQHIYHRDISIQNIRILNTGTPILIDFGAARHIVGEHSHSLDLVLKHGYSPLEQYSGKGKIGPWTDIYACGALLYLMMTGILPPAATDRSCEDCLVAPVTLGVKMSTSVNDAIMRALAIKHEERFQTVFAFKAALQGQVPLNVESPPPLISNQPLQSKHQADDSPRQKFVLISILFFLIILSSLFFYLKKETVDLAPLLLQAKNQLAHEKLIQPNGDNAYETYQQILTDAPNNAQAKAGLVKIAQHYFFEAKKTSAAGQWEESLEIIKQGLSAMPTYADLLAMEQSVKAELAVEINHIRTTQLKVKLLNQAEQYLAMSQLEAAYTTYQKVLVQEPNNQSAQVGLRRVLETYMQIAQNQNGNLSDRLVFISNGLTVFPKHPGLLALKNALNDEKRAKQRELKAKQTRQRQLELEVQLARQREREMKTKQARLRQLELEAQQAKQQKMARLLKKANHQLSALRLTTPADDNAYETYQKILSMAPDNLQAQAGLVKIANKYEQLARISRYHKQTKLAFIKRGLKVLPTHAGLQALHKNLVKAKKKIVQTTAPQQPVVKQTPSAQIQKTPLATNHHVTEPSTPLKQEKPHKPDNTVQNLLKIAKEHFKAAQFEAAYQTYRNVLRIAQENPSAKNGLLQIAHRYEQLANSQYKEGKLVESLSLVKKGLAAVPTYPGLLALQASITRSIQEKAAIEKTQPSHLIFTPSF